MKSMSRYRYVLAAVLALGFLAPNMADAQSNEHTIEMPNYKLVQSYLDSISGHKGPYWVFACMPSQLRYTIVIPYGKNNGVLIMYVLGQIIKANTLTYNRSTATWTVGQLPNYKSFYVSDKDLQQSLASDQDVKSDISKIMANYPKFYLMNETSVSSLVNVIQNPPHMKSVECPGLSD